MHILTLWCSVCHGLRKFADSLIFRYYVYLHVMMASEWPEEGDEAFFWQSVICVMIHGGEWDWKKGSELMTAIKKEKHINSKYIHWTVYFYGAFLNLNFLTFTPSVIVHWVFKKVWRSGRVVECNPVGRRFAPRMLLLELSSSVELVRHLWKMSEKFDIYSKIFFRDVENFFRHLCELVLRHQMLVSNYFVNSFYSAVAGVLDEPYSQLIPFSGVAVQARKST